MLSADNFLIQFGGLRLRYVICPSSGTIWRNQVFNISWNVILTVPEEFSKYFFEKSGVILLDKFLATLLWIAIITWV